jgi:hypothetical protein
MALGDQLGDGSLMKRAGDQEDDVVDHVAVGDVVQEGGQITCGSVLETFLFVTLWCRFFS